MRTSKKPKLKISDNDFKELKKLSVSRTSSPQSVLRVKIL